MPSEPAAFDPVAIEAGLTAAPVAQPWWVSVLKMLCGAIFFILFAIMMMEVVNRFYDLIDIRWSEEVSRSLLIWFVFIGFGLASGLDQNIKADLTSSIGHPVVRRGLAALATVCTVLLLIGLVVTGTQLTMISANSRMVSLDLSSAVVTSAVAVGAGLGLTILLGRFVARLRATSNG